MVESEHDFSARSTADSKAEGRLKESFLTRKKKKKIIKSVIKKKYGK